MSVVRLTDRLLKSLDPAPRHGRVFVSDAACIGLVAQVNDKGVVSFMLSVRYPGSKHPTRRLLGTYYDGANDGNLTLADAREKARQWRRMIADGRDPAVEKEKERLTEQRRQGHTFATVAEAFIESLKRRGLRTAHQAEGDIRRSLIPKWGKRPITEIVRADLVEVLESEMRRKSHWQAHHVYSAASRLFSWAIETDRYGLTSSPCDHLRPARLIGAKESRTRVLTDDEIYAAWRGAGRLGYPFGPIIRLLLLTGQRRSEVAEAHKDEVADDMWTIPAARMKGKADHLVPLSTLAIETFASLPEFGSGDFLFTTTMGDRPVSGFSKAKKLLDREMLKVLRAMARARGEDWHKVKLKPFVMHDLRRTVRTRLGELGVDQHVCELVIAHARPGLHRVYDLHAYLPEKRRALAMWADRLSSIVKPRPANVIPLRRAQ